MPTAITASFQKLKENLEITGLQKATVSTRQNNVREVLERDLTESWSSLFRQPPSFFKWFPAHTAFLISGDVS